MFSNTNNVNIAIIDLLCIGSINVWYYYLHVHILVIKISLQSLLYLDCSHLVGTYKNLK